MAFRGNNSLCIRLAPQRVCSISETENCAQAGPTGSVFPGTGEVTGYVRDSGKTGGTLKRALCSGVSQQPLLHSGRRDSARLYLLMKQVLSPAAGDPTGDPWVLFGSEAGQDS